MTHEEQFEARYWHLAGIPKIAAWQAWKAATNVALGQAEKACEAIKNDKWALYKGWPPHTMAVPGRADNYVQGESDGAGLCAKAIRELKDER